MSDVENGRAMTTEELNACFQELEAKKPLSYLIYYITNAKEDMFPFVRVYDTDDGYRITDIIDENKVLLDLNVLDSQVGNESISITGGEWAGLELSCKDEHVLMLADILLESYREEPIKEE